MLSSSMDMQYQYVMSVVTNSISQVYCVVAFLHATLTYMFALRWGRF